MMTEAELMTELGRAYRALRGIYGTIANGETPDRTMLAYHSPTIGAAIRFVSEGALDGTGYFIGKPIEVLHEALRSVHKHPESFSGANVSEGVTGGESPAQ